MRIEFLTTIPKRASTPISAGKESGVWVSAKTIKTPEMESGITSITMMAFLKDENCRTIVIIISMNDSIIACRMELTEF